MLTVAQDRLQKIAAQTGKKVSIHLFGQELQPETYAIAKADMMLKGDGEEAMHIAFGSTLSSDQHANALKIYSEQKEDSDIEAFLTEAVENDDFSECIQSYLGKFNISRDYYSEWECDEHQIEVDEAELLYVERTDEKYLVHLALSLLIVADITHRDEDTSY